LVVLDPHRGGLGRAEGVDAEQVGQRAVVPGDGLGDLEEPDELEAVQPLGAGLIAVDPGQPDVDGAGRRGSGPSTWANRKNPRRPCIIVQIEESLSPQSRRRRM
jgi:hypothetical protein